MLAMRQGMGLWLVAAALLAGCGATGTEITAGRGSGPEANAGGGGLAAETAAGAGRPLESGQPVAPAGRTRVVLLGTGTPGAEPDRSGPATAIVVDDTPYLVDFGPGVVRRATAAYVSGVEGLRVQNLRLAFLTHLHSDHTAGFPDLILTPWVLGRREPLHVYGPPGVAAMSENILEAYREDIRVRVGGAEMLDPAGVRVVPHEIAEERGVVYEDDLVSVEAFAVPHGTWEHAFGFKFVTVDRTVVVSGDTGPFDGLVEIARDADVLLHEAYTSAAFYRRNLGTRRYHGTFHTSATKVGEIAARANVGMVILYHQLHLAGDSPEQMVADVQAPFDGPVFYGRDLDVH